MIPILFRKVYLKIGRYHLISSFHNFSGYFRHDITFRTNFLHFSLQRHFFRTRKCFREKIRCATKFSSLHLAWMTYVVSQYCLRLLLHIKGISYSYVICKYMLPEYIKPKWCHQHEFIYSQARRQLFFFRRVNAKFIRIQPTIAGEKWDIIISLFPPHNIFFRNKFQFGFWKKEI